MWQIIQIPQNMAFLDAQPVGCIWTRSAQSVANDLIFLTEVGVTKPWYDRGDPPTWLLGTLGSLF